VQEDLLANGIEVSNSIDSFLGRCLVGVLTGTELFNDISQSLQSNMGIVS
jgi:hypothetical protein